MLNTCSLFFFFFLFFPHFFLYQPTFFGSSQQPPLTVKFQELQNKIGGLNRTVPKNDKEGRKRLQQEIKKLEDDQKARHENEIKAFEACQKDQGSQVTNEFMIYLNHLRVFIFSFFNYP